MNIELSHKMITEMCGPVSFKRGDYFYRNNKVTFEKYSPDHWQAIVNGDEAFYVTIETDEHGKIRSECSCPKLASFKKECQHVAAVLLAIYHRGQPRQELAEGLLTIFDEKPIRNSGHQRHFEKRTVLDVGLICKPVEIGNGQYIIGIEIAKVNDIRAFLEQVRDGRSFPFPYDPSLHCFQQETDRVIQELIHVMRDEHVFGKSSGNMNKIILPIPSTSWERLLPLLLKTPNVRIEHEGQLYEGLSLSEGVLPLQFDFSKKELAITGLGRLIILDSYRSVLFAGKIKQLEDQDYKRLLELKKMLAAAGRNEIPIPPSQLLIFIEKIAPGLKRLGQVNIDEPLREQLKPAPLVAKLYLDRVKNRLLAGLEFHYQHVVINPLEGREFPAGVMVMRDTAKEQQILEIMDESSFAKTDGGYFLQNEELEYEFLVHVVPKLQKLMQIYATTAVRNRIVLKDVFPKIRVKVRKERTNWLDFKFEMKGISNEEIREVLAALEEKRKYYRLPNGSLLSLQTREFEEIQRYLKSPLLQDQDLADGLSLPVEQCLQLLDTVEVSDAFKLEESFRQFMDELRNPGRLEFAVPSGLEPTLKEYQKVGFKWMKTLAHYGFGGILADDMGLGKTIQSIAYIVSVVEEVRDSKLRVLVVCPSSVVYNWLSELGKFAPDLRAVVIDGSKDKRSELLANLDDVNVLITSYPLLRRDIKWFEKQTFHTVFFDEAQAFKNPLTQTARAVKKLQAGHRFALTGTPVENSAEELWSIFHVVFPELFLGLKEFSRLSRGKIARRIRPFILRRVKEDVLAELPEKREFLETVELYPEQKKLYAAYLAKLRHDTLKHLDKDTIRKNRIRILAGLTRLRQICCHPGLFVDGYDGGSTKFTQLMEILDESRLSGRRVLIFSQFTKMLQIIGRTLTAKGQAYFYLDGSTPSEERVEICDRFNHGERDLFLISLKAGGTGLNLMGADTVILYDTWWNPAVEEQAADRAHRMGQKNVVQVIKLVARGTIEEKMNELQDKKRHLVEDILDSDEKVMGFLTEEDIREILMV
ncbi:DEAD/DEAH box helicase [Neobacillus niacini]|uniref:DEAD/DEAH box helicase n=1 Tax=Neobacillus niacini TaxID=86668 RepID=UPI0021CAF582|nr:DEAD/DEAH box helicase [Neobacillus niacini]MCM3767663.1 DEAD/DEAH box helicase [Neobacillus niacini]